MARRSACTAPRRWAGCCSGRRSAAFGAAASAASAFVFVFGGDRRVRWPPSPIALRGPRDARADAPRAGARCRPSSRPTPPSHDRRAAADVDADAADREPTARADAPLEPRPDRGPRHQRRRLLRRRHLRGDLEPVPDRLGAGLDLIGLTFAMFGLPVLLLSPFAGRLVDGAARCAFIVIGSILPAVDGAAYTLIADPMLAVPLILVEATGFAMLNPALYAVVAANSPVGRSSTAQGMFGAAGRSGSSSPRSSPASLAQTNIVYPMYVFAAVLIGVTLVLGLLIGGPRLNGRADAQAFDRIGLGP